MRLGAGSRGARPDLIFPDFLKAAVKIEQRQFCVCAHHERVNRNGSFPMNYRGIEYSIAVTPTPGIWKWQFRIGDEVKTGKTETRIGLLAVRRVQMRIDRALKLAESAPTS